MNTVIGFWAKTVYCARCRKSMIVNGYRHDLRPLCPPCAEDAQLERARERQDKDNDAIRDAVVDALKAAGGAEEKE